ncbi:MAG: rod shape-determining protein MreC [Peptococcaceae bacterium]|nr:rod shape-determining protein MreC [Peptococcaceae bacterium]
MRWQTFKRFFLLALLAAVTLAAMRFTGPERTRLTPFEGKIKDLLAPVQVGLTWLGGKMYSAASFPVSMVAASRKSRELEGEIARLQSELIRLTEIELENQRLAGLLNYRQAVVKRYDFITASVVGRDPGSWFGTVTLNRGSRDGVVENMTVTTPEGLVGRTVSVSEHTCEVLLITDPRSGVGAVIQESRVPGIVEGTAASAGLARMVHIPNGADVVSGQAVVTSGVGSIYPKGIPIGVVADIKSEPSGLFKSAGIQPFADLNRLEELLIITRVYPETAAR